MPGVRERMSLGKVERTNRTAALLAVKGEGPVEHRLGKETCDVGAGADLCAEVRRYRRHSHRADGTQIRDDIASGLHDRRAHLGRGGTGIETNDHDPERVRLLARVGGSSGEECRGAE